MSVKLIENSNAVNKTDCGKSYLLKPVTETITNGFFTVDSKWTVTHWNKASETLLRIQSKDIIGKNIWEIFAGIIPLEFYTAYHKAFLHDIPLHFQEYWVEMGTWFDVITWQSGHHLSVSFKSINQSGFQERPLEQLRALNELYRLVTEVTNDCLWEWDFGSKEILWIDGGHKKAFGYQVENLLIPQSFWESRLHPEDKERVLAGINKVITEASAAIWEDEYRFKKANGDYAFVHDRGHIIYESGKACRMIGATQDISKKVQLENKLAKERQANQREITEAVLTAQENERAEIGKELHDNLNQILAVAKMYIQMAQRNEKERKVYLDKTRGFIENVIEEIRKLSKILVIPGTHIIGLFDNVKNLVNDLMAIHPLKIEFYAAGIVEKELNENLQVTLFRIIQEQLNNILKHAGASRATIHLSRPENDVVLLISDNGRGCDISKEKKGVGLININSRANLYDGQVMIVSKPGEGFVLKVVLPFK